MSNDPQSSPQPPQRTLQRWAPLLVVALLTVIFFIPWLFQGKVFLAADNLYRFLPWASVGKPGIRPHNSLITDPVNYGFPAAYNRQLKEGVLRKWNPLVMGGVPAVNSTSSGSPGRYYFVKALYNRLFPPATAVMMLLFTHLLLMGVFMYWYLLEIGAGRRGALLGAVAWMFSGCSMVWFEFEIVLTAGTFIPLLLLVMERFLGARPYLWACVGSLVFGTYVLIGHLQFLLYLSLLMLFYFAYLAWRIHRREPGLRRLGHLAACFGITCTGALLIGALELLPMAEVITNSSRVARSFGFRSLFDTLGQVYFRHLVTLIFPDYFGSPVLGMTLTPQLPRQEYMNYNELCLYLGLPTLFALMAAAVGFRDAATRFWLLLTVLFASMMLGAYTFYPFFKWYPGLGKVNPTRIIFLFTLAATVTAGLGVSPLDGLSRTRRRVFLAAAAVLVATTLVLALVSARPQVVRWFNVELASGSQWQYYSRWLAKTRALASPTMLKPLLLAGGSFLLFSAYLLIGNKKARLAIFSLILALLAYDLISFGRNYNTTTSPAYLFARTPAIDFLKKQGGVFRVVQDTSKGFFFNSLAPFGIEELGGYTNAYPDRLNRLLSHIEYRNTTNRFDRWVGFSPYGQWRFHSLMNVRWLLTARGTPPLNPNLRLAFREEIDVYENSRVLPRAFVVHRALVEQDVDTILRTMASSEFDPGSTVVLEEKPPSGFAPTAPPPSAGSADITKYSEDRMEIAADLPANGWLVVSNTFYPGWEATSDGKSVRLQRADCAITAVPLEAGRHNVVLEYRPKSIARGRALTLLGLALSLAGIGTAAYLGRRRTA